MTHQSPSPLCEVDKSSLADLPRSAVSTRQEDQRTSTTDYDWRGKKDPEAYTVSNLYSKKALVITNAMYSVPHFIQIITNRNHPITSTKRCVAPY